MVSFPRDQLPLDKRCSLFHRALSRENRLSLRRTIAAKFLPPKRREKKKTLSNPFESSDKELIRLLKWKCTHYGWENEIHVFILERFFHQRLELIRVDTLINQFMDIRLAHVVIIEVDATGELVLVNQLVQFLVTAVVKKAIYILFYPSSNEESYVRSLSLTVLSSRCPPRRSRKASTYTWRCNCFCCGSTVSCSSTGPRTSPPIWLCLCRFERDNFRPNSADRYATFHLENRHHVISSISYRYPYRYDVPVSYSRNIFASKSPALFDRKCTINWSDSSSSILPFDGSIQKQGLQFYLRSLILYFFLFFFVNKTHLSV